VAYTVTQYRADIVKSLYAAVGLTFIAALPLGLLGVVDLVEALSRRPLEVPWGTYFAIIVAVPASYALAAVLAASAAFITRPLRANVVGWVLTGALMTPIVYGSVGLMLAVLYDPVGATFLEHSTRHEVWAMIPLIMGLLAPMGGALGAYAWWRDRKGKPLL
jgi:hypothetical protein